ncbi:hypothetical protein SEA_RASPUTIA_113 [Microbacterium phage Rasputia]|nr:hypothetical protein SEA_RASPUTIA_113 [Microbacterium phage Rasputia]
MIMAGIDSCDLLTRKDVKKFDKGAQKLLFAMQDAGWRGRIGGQGHVIMYAPDRITTAAFSSDSENARAGHNARAVFKRWLRSQEVAQ